MKKRARLLNGLICLFLMVATISISLPVQAVKAADTDSPVEETAVDSPAGVEDSAEEIIAFVEENTSDTMLTSTTDPISSVSAATTATGSISGHVYQSDGRAPIANADISVSSTDTNYKGSTTTNAEGSYSIAGLPSGNYKVLAKASGYISSNFMGNENYPSTEVEVLPLLETSGIDIILITGGSISGHVYKPDGTTAIANAEVSAERIGKSSGYGHTKTDSEGSYTIVLLTPGDYAVRVTAQGYLQALYKGAFGNKADPVNVLNQVNTPGIDFTLETGGCISGHIYQADGKTPVADAYVSVWSQGQNEYNSSVHSAADGSYIIETLPSGNYFIYVAADDFLGQYYPGTLQSEKAMPVAVSSPAVTANIDFKLEAGGSSSGYVFRSDGTTPIMGAGITARLVKEDSDRTWSAHSNTDGSYTIKALLPGDYIVSSSASGYILKYYDDNPGFSLARPVPVPISGNTSGINFTLDKGKGGSISGHVYQVDGTTPAPGIQVYATSGNYNYGGSVMSRNDGSYTVGSLSPGSYRVYTRTDNYIPVYYPGTYNIRLAESVTVTTEENPQGINLILDRGGSISGRVFQKDGVTPVAHANMYAYLTDRSYLSEALTDSDGIYTIGALVPGNYKVRAESNKFIPEYFSGGFTSDEADPVNVAERRETAGINFTLEKGGSISGHVYQADGKTAVYPANIRVTRTVESDSYFHFSIPETEVNEDGSFIVTRLTPGDYIVMVSAPGYITQYYPQADNVNQAIPISVTLEADIADINFKLDRGGSISGHVYQSDGKTPIKYATVSVSTGNVDDVTTQADGSYTLSGLPSGNYKISAYATGYTGAYYGGAYYAEEATQIRITAPNTRQNINFKLDKGGSISGHVYGPDDESLVLTDFYVNVIHLKTGKRPSPLLTSSLPPRWGFYIIRDLPPGDYQLKIQATNYLSEYYYGVYTSEEAASVKVKLAEETANIDFTLVRENTPMVVSTYPKNKAGKVKVDTLPRIIFNEEMDDASVQNGFFIFPPTVGKLELNGSVLTFKPEKGLAYGKTYTITLASDIKDTAGNLLGAIYTWNFSTAAWPTTVITRENKVLSDTSVRLSGTISNPVGATDVEVFFEWGTTKQYGHATAAQTLKKGGDFSTVLKDLLPNTQYHFRAAAKGDGTVYGGDRVFTTKPGYRLNMTIRGQGSITPESGGHSYKRGSVVDISAVPSEGWQFERWTGEVADVKAASTTVTLDRNKTVAAVFSKIVYYSLTLGTKGKGTIDPAAGSHRYTAGTQVEITATAGAGWKFDKWSGNASGKANPLTITLKGNKKITANFVPAGITSIKDILDQVEIYNGYTVNLRGEYRGQEEGHGVPPVSPRDWIMRDESGAIWVSGGGTRFKPADVGKVIQLTGRVKLKNGTAYILFSRVVK